MIVFICALLGLILFVVLTTYLFYKEQSEGAWVCLIVSLGFLLLTIWIFQITQAVHDKIILRAIQYDHAKFEIVKDKKGKENRVLIWKTNK